MESRWLITGAAGMLGDYLAEACARQGSVTTTSRSGGDVVCDLTGRQAVHDLLSAAAPDIVIHAAGLTDVDRCQAEPEAAYAANRDTAAHLASSLPHTSRIVFISTDQVYPDTAGPHGEETAGPVNVYGESKLAGERAALEHPRCVVLRTNFFGPSRRPGRRSLSDFFHDGFSKGQSVTLFGDVFFSPLHMSTLSDIVVEIADRGLAGVYNAGCRDGSSKAAFALELARHMDLDTSHAEAGSSATLPGRAPRPHDLRLDVSRIERALGRSMPALDEEIAKL